MPAPGPRPAQNRIEQIAWQSLLPGTPSTAVQILCGSIWPVKPATEYSALLSGGPGPGELAFALERLGTNVGDEPRHDVPQSDDARARVTAARQIMGLALEADHPDLASEQLERGEQLLTFGDGAAQVSIGVQDQEWRGDPLHVGDRRALHQPVQVLPGNGVHRIDGQDPVEVAGAEDGGHVADAAHRHGRLETVGMAHRPVRHVATVAAAGDAEPLRIDPAV